MQQVATLPINNSLLSGQNAYTMHPGTEFHRILQEYMQQLSPPLSWYKLAEYSGIRQSHFSKWKSGARGPSQSEMEKIAGVKHLKLSYEDLVQLWTEAKYGTSIVTKPENLEGFYKVPILGAVSAGTLSLIDNPDEIQEYIAFYDLKKFGSDLFALRVRGNSMEPHIPDGAVLVCRKADSITNKGIYVVETVDGEATVKVLQYEGSEPQLKPFNTNHPPILLQDIVIRRIFQVLEYKVDVEGRTL